MSKDKVIAFGPASVANVGPFYDVMGYCLDHLGDVVIAEKTSKHNNVVLNSKIMGEFAYELESEDVLVIDNCAHIVAQAIWGKLARGHVDFGINLTLHKCMPTQSGLGSSAASCVAAAKAMFQILDLDEKSLDESDVTNWLIAGEKASAGHHYPDNVIPSYRGGFYLINREWLKRIKTGRFWTVVFMKDRAKTKEMRGRVDEHFDLILDETCDVRKKTEKVLEYLRTYASYSGKMISALYEDDMASFGKAMSLTKKNFLDECRGDLIAHYRKEKEYLMKNGALGCTISGSGPSIACIVKSRDDARKLRDTYLKKFGEGCNWLMSEINNSGAETFTNLEEWKEINRKYHNFWG